MTGVILRDMSGAFVRSNPRYCFTPFEKLSETELTQLGGNPARSGFSGVLTDAGSGGLRIKAVSRETARLFNDLRTAVPVNEVLTEYPAHERDEIVAGLVLDGVFEIAVERIFVSGCAAYHLMVENDDNICGRGRLAELSVCAIKHGQRLLMTDPEALAARLYFYNRVPVACSRRGLWPDSDAILRYLGAASGGALRHDLTSGFEMVSPSGNIRWFSWHRMMEHRRQRGLKTYKLYVSPRPQSIRDAFAEVVALLHDSNALSLKIASNAQGLMRPDKLVVYFDRPGDLFTFAEALLKRISDWTAQGVPFSAPIDDGGFLSWGIDPPRSVAGIGWYADDSWRIWVCNRIAVALIAAMKSSEREVTPWRYALTKLSLSGVDTRTWTFQEKADLTSDGLGEEPL